MSSQREAPHPYLQAWTGFHQKRQMVEGSEDPLHGISPSGTQVVAQAKSATLIDPSLQALPGLRKRSDHRSGGHKVVKGLQTPQLPSSSWLEPEPHTAMVLDFFSLYALIITSSFRNLPAVPHTPLSIQASAPPTPSGSTPSSGSINHLDGLMQPSEGDVRSPFPSDNRQGAPHPGSVRFSLKHSSRSASPYILR
jgi:hypothetical protein